MCMSVFAFIELIHTSIKSHVLALLLLKADGCPPTACPPEVSDFLKETFSHFFQCVCSCGNVGCQESNLCRLNMLSFIAYEMTSVVNWRYRNTN